MFRYFSGIAFIVVMVGLTGCSGLGNMKVVDFSHEIEPDMAMVNFVRRHAFIGDGAKVEVWDGDSFIGTLSSGRLLQYKTKPGNHTFMIYVQGRWAVAKGELKSGKTYYLKFNMTGLGGINLGVAKSYDPRIEIWNEMRTVVIDKSSPKDIPEKYISSARKTLERVERGNGMVTPITDMDAL